MDIYIDYELLSNGFFILSIYRGGHCERIQLHTMLRIVEIIKNRCSSNDTIYINCCGFGEYIADSLTLKGIPFKTMQIRRADYRNLQKKKVKKNDKFYSSGCCDLICEMAKTSNCKVTDVRPKDGGFELSWSDADGNYMKCELLDSGRSKVTEYELETMCFVHSDLLSHEALADIVGMAFKKAFNPDYLKECKCI